MPPLPSDAAPRPPGDFAGVLATAEPLLLVGGQAVNLWALSYHDRTSDLAPFVSRDADVLGGRETLKALGRLTGTKPQFFPLRPPSNEIGVVIAKDAAGASLLVAVLRQVPREHYVPGPKRSMAYTDAALEIVPGRWLIEPMSLALLLNHAQFQLSVR